ncbi:MAG TPA: ABC transporter ATP-binding protein [Candidatus Dormibacteraeota bacterium]|nr:ABC transporter ATP-binding protein [Candidatus Dormibacteraeota bacterium]
MPRRVIEVEGLRKSYGSLMAVNGVDLTVSEGEVFALLGPNGAGKTTTVEILEGFRTRDAGRVSVLGVDPATHARRLREQMGIVLQSTGIDPYLTVAETIDMYRGFYPHPRSLDEVITLVGLEEKRTAKVEKLSGGQKRRLDVGIALAGDPEVLFLDEPTTGFDPNARRHAWEVVKNLAKLGKTIFLTTHYMDEAQYLADRVAVISAGQIVAEGDPGTLAGRDRAGTTIRFRLPERAGLPEAVSQKATIKDGIVELKAEDPTQLLFELTSWAVSSHVLLMGLEVTRPSLEDVYLEITREAPPAAAASE